MAPVQARFEIVDTTLLREHEQVEAARVDVVEKRLLADGVVRQPVVADADTLVVLDGHHRLAALKRLGATRIPVHLVDYADAVIVLESWDPARAPPTKREVVQRAQEGRPFPPKTTKHPALYRLPVVPTALADLGVNSGT